MMNDCTITWPRTTFVSRTTPTPIEDTREEISYRLKCSHGNPPQDYCGDGTKNPKVSNVHAIKHEARTMRADSQRYLFSNRNPKNETQHHLCPNRKIGYTSGSLL